jgi:hypothetical protein
MWNFQGAKIIKRHKGTKVKRCKGAKAQWKERELAYVGEGKKMIPSWESLSVS